MVAKTLRTVSIEACPDLINGANPHLVNQPEFVKPTLDHMEVFVMESPDSRMIVIILQ